MKFLCLTNDCFITFQLPFDDLLVSMVIENPSPKIYASVSNHALNKLIVINSIAIDEFPNMMKKKNNNKNILVHIPSIQKQHEKLSTTNKERIDRTM